MSIRTWVVLCALHAVVASTAGAQSVSGEPSMASRFVDEVNGLSLEQAIARALAEEPSLRAERSSIDAARGTRLQAGLRRNPTASFERREEAGGSDNQTMIGVDWPLDLFRRQARIAVAEKAVSAAELAVTDRERLLAADVRSRYGDVLAAIREVTVLDDVIASVRRQHTLLRSRVDEGASPPLERDLVDVELRRLQADRVLQLGRTESAMFELKRVLGAQPSERVTVRHSLEEVVVREMGTAAAASVESSSAEERVDVREANTRVALADARVEQAQRDGRFDVSLVGGYMRMDSSFPQLGLSSSGTPERVSGLFHYLAAGAMVTVPLFNRNQGDIAALRAERSGAAASYEAARLSAQTEIATARVHDERAREAVALYSRGIRTAARQNLSVVNQSYELGRVTLFDVLAEQKRLLDVERAYTEALRAAYEARASLMRATGEMP